MGIGVDTRELSSEKEDLGRIVDPYYECNQGAGCAVGGSDTGPAEIQRQKQFADGE